MSSSLRIGKALSRSNRKIGAGKGTSSQQYDTASVHVTFISNQTNSLINEESLRNLFAQFGEVVDAVICKSHVDQVKKQRKLMIVLFLLNPTIMFRERIARVDTYSFTFLELQMDLNPLFALHKHSWIS